MMRIEHLLGAARLELIYVRICEEKPCALWLSTFFDPPYLRPHGYLIMGNRAAPGNVFVGAEGLEPTTSRM
jgi:hypothetical protein